MDCSLKGDLAALVTPPDGLKHRLLAAASHQDLVRGMRSSIQGMIAGGTAGCADFREGGAAGVSASEKQPGDYHSGLTFSDVREEKKLPMDWGSAAPGMVCALMR